MLKMNRVLQTQLLKMSNMLDDQEVEKLTFLCGNQLTARDKQEIKDGNALFAGLQKKGLISDNDLSFLKEIFCRIGRNDILKEHLSMTDGEIADLRKCPRHISSYRSLLYDISQELGTEDVKCIKFQLYPQHAKLQNKDILDVLTEMEKDGSLKENDLEKLKQALAEIPREDLRQRIQSYENQERQATFLDSTHQLNESKDGSGNGKNLEQYALNKIPHGWCVILNNEDFAKGRRKGTDKDAEAIRRVFENRNYTVEEHNNLTEQDMLNIMKKYQDNDHSDKDSFICFILSHGDRGTVFGVDEKKVSIKHLTNCVNGKNCPSLVGKPKIFFIQACQGDEVDEGVPYEADSSTTTYESDGRRLLPVSADFLIAYASSEDYVSLRGPNGSIYIQNLCKALEDPCNVQEDLENILTTLKKTISDEEYRVDQKCGKQMPVHTTQLRKQLILPPPGKKPSQ